MKRISKNVVALLMAATTLTGTHLMAQETATNELKYPTLEDLIPGGATYRYAESLYGLQWWGDQCIKPGIDSLVAVNPKNGKETLLTTRESINQALEAEKLGKLSHLYNVQLPWEDQTKLLITLPGRYITYDWKAGKTTDILTFDKKAANTDYTVAGGHVAYTLKNNLYVDNKQVTDEPEGIVCGQSVHRNEFGISKGTFWSPKGTLLAFYRMDESMVTQYPLVDITARVGEVNNIRYPMAGMTSHKVQVGIYNPANGKTVYLNTGDPTDRYFTNIAWAPDEKTLFLIELNRDQNHSNAHRGKTPQVRGAAESHPVPAVGQQQVHLPESMRRLQPPLPVRPGATSRHPTPETHQRRGRETVEDYREGRKGKDSRRSRRHTAHFGRMARAEHPRLQRQEEGSHHRRYQGVAPAEQSV